MPKDSWIDIICECCGNPARKQWTSRRQPRFCDKKCSARYRSTTAEGQETHRKGGAAAQRVFRETGTQPMLNPVVRAASSIRMFEKNPMRDMETREKMRNTLLAIGHKPVSQGGKGRPLSEPQKLLLSYIPSREPEVYFGANREIKKLFGTRASNYATDLAHLPTKVAIEVDGGSHTSLKVQSRDQKKTEILTYLGWTVLRFKNEEILENTLQTVLQIQECILQRMSMISK